MTDTQSPTKEMSRLNTDHSTLGKEVSAKETDAFDSTKLNISTTPFSSSIPDIESSSHPAPPTSTIQISHNEEIQPSNPFDVPCSHQLNKSSDNQNDEIFEGIYGLKKNSNNQIPTEQKVYLSKIDSSSSLDQYQSTIQSGDKEEESTRATNSFDGVKSNNLLPSKASSAPDNGSLKTVELSESRQLQPLNPFDLPYSCELDISTEKVSGDIFEDIHDKELLQPVFHSDNRDGCLQTPSKIYQPLEGKPSPLPPFDSPDSRAPSPRNPVIEAEKITDNNEPLQSTHQIYNGNFQGNLNRIETKENDSPTGDRSPPNYANSKPSNEHSLGKSSRKTVDNINLLISNKKCGDDGETKTLSKQQTRIMQKMDFLTAISSNKIVHQTSIQQTEKDSVMEHMGYLRQLSQSKSQVALPEYTAGSDTSCFDSTSEATASNINNNGWAEDKFSDADHEQSIEHDNRRRDSHHFWEGPYCYCMCYTTFLRIIHQICAPKVRPPCLPCLCSRRPHFANQISPQRRQIICRSLIIIFMIITITFTLLDLLILHRYLHVWLDSTLQWLSRNPAAGGVAFVGIFLLGSLCFFPVSLLALGAGYVYIDLYGVTYGIFVAFIVCYIGCIIGSAVCFVRSRYLMRRLILKFSNRYPIVRAVDRAFATMGFRIFLLLRLSPAMPFNALNYIGGITSISFQSYLRATCVGIVPGLLWTIFVGATFGTIDNRGVDGNKEFDKDGVRKGVLLGLGIGLGVMGIIGTGVYARRELTKIVLAEQMEVMMEESQNSSVRDNMCFQNGEEDQDEYSKSAEQNSIPPSVSIHSCSDNPQIGECSEKIDTLNSSSRSLRYRRDVSWGNVTCTKKDNFANEEVNESLYEDVQREDVTIDMFSQSSPALLGASKMTEDERILSWREDQSLRAPASSSSPKSQQSEVSPPRRHTYTPEWVEAELSLVPSIFRRLSQGFDRSVPIKTFSSKSSSLQMAGTGESLEGSTAREDDEAPLERSIKGQNPSKNDEIFISQSSPSLFGTTGSSEGNPILNTPKDDGGFSFRRHSVANVGFRGKNNPRHISGDSILASSSSLRRSASLHDDSGHGKDSDDLTRRARANTAPNGEDFPLSQLQRRGDSILLFDAPQNRGRASSLVTPSVGSRSNIDTGLANIDEAAVLSFPHNRSQNLGESATLQTTKAHAMKVKLENRPGNRQRSNTDPFAMNIGSIGKEQLDSSPTNSSLSANSGIKSKENKRTQLKSPQWMPKKKLGLVKRHSFASFEAWQNRGLNGSVKQDDSSPLVNNRAGGSPSKESKQLNPSENKNDAQNTTQFSSSGNHLEVQAESEETLDEPSREWFWIWA